MRGAALKERGLEAAGPHRAKTGARLLCDTFTPQPSCGAGRVPVERIPYFAEQIVEFLAGLEQLILVGAKPPVSFFAYPGKPSWCVARRLRDSHVSRSRTKTAPRRARGSGRSARRAGDAPVRVPLKLPRSADAAQLTA